MTKGQIDTHNKNTTTRIVQQFNIQINGSTELYCFTIFLGRNHTMEPGWLNLMTKLSKQVQACFEHACSPSCLIEKKLRNREGMGMSWSSWHTNISKKTSFIRELTNTFKAKVTLYVTFFVWSGTYGNVEWIQRCRIAALQFYLDCAKDDASSLHST